MAVTDVSICNSALAKLGAERIISLSDTSARAVLMKEQFEKIRDELLYSHPWNFATARAEIAPLVADPLYDFDYQFQLPSDCLRVIGTDIPNAGAWKVEGRILVCNQNAVNIKYIKQVTDASQFTPGFAEVLAAKLAADVCYAITQSATLQDRMDMKYRDQLRQARSFDAQESTGDRVYADTWFNSRA